MTQITVDARGLESSISIMKTKKAIEDINSDNILTIVDSKVAKENVTKLAKDMNCSYNVLIENDEYYIDIVKNMGNKDMDIVSEEVPSLYDSVILVNSNKFGEGNSDLGDILIEGYFYTLSEMDTYPRAIVFLNSGVYLTIEESKIIKNLRILESKGVQLISCRTCLDFYDLKDKFAVGGISCMFAIVEILNNCKKVITL